MATLQALRGFSTSLLTLILIILPFQTRKYIFKIRLSALYEKHKALKGYNVNLF